MRYAVSNNSTAFSKQKIKFSINDFFSKFGQIRKKSLMENFIFLCSD